MIHHTWNDRAVKKQYAFKLQMAPFDCEHVKFTWEVTLITFYAFQINIAGCHLFIPCVHQTKRTALASEKIPLMSLRSGTPVSKWSKHKVNDCIHSAQMHSMKPNNRQIAEPAWFFISSDWGMGKKLQPKNIGYEQSRISGLHAQLHLVVFRPCVYTNASTCWCMYF